VTGPGADAGPSTGGDSGFTGALLYVANDDGTLHAYAEGTWIEVGTWSGLPLTDGVRGIDADPQTGNLYMAHGADDDSSNGHLLAWNMGSGSVVYDVAFNHGIDQMGIFAGKIYLAAGEVSSTSTWYILNEADGSQIGTEQGGLAPHNTIARNGHRYEGGRQSNSLVIHGIGAGAVGPSPSSQAGVRPFTVNAAETRVYITWTRYRGYSVGDVATGQIVASVNFGSIPSNYSATAASHGISLSPDGTELWVLDAPYNQVRVYDSSDSPQLRATVSLNSNIFPGNESPCAYDCPRDGWLLHSRDGKYVYVGDSGDVIETASRTVAGHLDALANSRHGFVEVEWTQGVPTGTTTHFGMGY